MRLLHVDTHEIHQFQAAPFPPYAILSHMWGYDGDEVTFQDMTASPQLARGKLGFDKIERCCARAREDEIDYVWIDTCCIDKTSSSELSEAINSMYAWYEGSRICYAYLSDVPSSSSVLPMGPTQDEPFDRDGVFRRSRWFTRGWTLQELLAPTSVEFYAADWTEIGTKASLTSVLEATTHIGGSVLGGDRAVTACNVAERLSWAAGRNTTRVEDAAYSLLGLFGVAMPLIYGEGRRSFVRLQEEIMRTTEDYSLLAWGLAPPFQGFSTAPRKVPSTTLSDVEGIAGAAHYKRVSPLADAPSAFRVDPIDWRDWRYSNLMLNSAVNVPWLDGGVSVGSLAPDYSPPQMTARGLRVWLAMHRCTPTVSVAFIYCSMRGRLVCAFLHRVGGQGTNVYERVSPPQGVCCFLPASSVNAFRRRLIYIAFPQPGSGNGAESQLALRLPPFVESLEVELEIRGPKVVYAGGWDAREREACDITGRGADAVRIDFMASDLQIVRTGGVWHDGALEALQGVAVDLLSPFERRDRRLRHGDGFVVTLAYKRLGNRSVARLLLIETPTLG